MTKISIIIPVYNVEKYLRECLDSILVQTLKEIEILCINDGSKDNSLAIMKEYGERDARVIVVDKKNEGVSKTRNLGIVKAKGEFVAFMDPDDIYPTEDVLEALYHAAKSNNVLICGGEFAAYRNGVLSQNYTERFYGYLFDSDSRIAYEDYQYDYGYHRFIYNRKFLIDNNIIYPDYKRYQDPPFFVNAMIQAREFYAIDKITYGYRKGHVVVKWTKDKVVDNLKGIRDVIIYAKRHRLPRLKKLQIERLIFEYFSNFEKNLSLAAYVQIFILSLLSTQLRQFFIRKILFRG